MKIWNVLPENSDQINTRINARCQIRKQFPMTNNVNKSHKNKNLDFEKIPKISKFQQGRMKSNREANTRRRSSLPLYDYQSRPAANASAIDSSKNLQIDFNCNGNLSSKLLHIAAVSVETTLHTKRK